jgi:hypothetical protein
MNTLEREIMDKFHQLQPAAKLRVRALIEQVMTQEAEVFDYDTWFREVEALRQQIRAIHEDNLTSLDAVGILHDMRDGENE